MPNLKNNEFQMISDILLELYSITNLEELENYFLTNVRALIPYNQSNFRAVSPHTGEVLKDGTVFIDTDPSMIPVFFNNIEPEENYLKNLFHYKDSIVYNETDLLEEEVRRNTRFYKEYLFPQKIPYGSGIILIENGILTGVLSLFRSVEWGDFTEKEIFILDLFKSHLAKMVSRCTLKQEHSVHFDDSNLTPREREITNMLLKGYSNEEIAEELTITISTTKKHVYNIFNKYQVKNRMALIKLLAGT